jgi:hypothetical protein
VKHGAKNSQMLMGTKNTMYKDKTLHVHRNNKNHISENQNNKYIHCFLIHLTKNKIKKSKIKNTQIHGLIYKRQRPFFSKKHLKIATSSSRSPNKKKLNFFAF